MGTKRFNYQNDKHHWHLNIGKLRRINRLYALLDAERLYGIESVNPAEKQDISVGIPQKVDTLLNLQTRGKNK